MRHPQLSASATLVRHWLAALLLVASSADLAAFERRRITFLGTTDTHGHIYPVDYLTDRPTRDGLAKIQTLILQARKADPDLILLDCGDTIQGTLLALHHMRFTPEKADPMILAMNRMGYGCMTVGNHEFGFGRAALAKARSEAKFPWLSANIVRKSDQKPLFAPYIVKEVDGIRVAILGLTTPGVPNWEPPERIADLDFLDPVQTAARYVPILRSQERADVVVVAAHLGLEEDLATGNHTPNPTTAECGCIAIAKTVPGIDLLFMGHIHRNTPAVVINNTLITQAGHWADRLAQAEVYLERESTDRPWRVIARSATTTAPGAETEADPAILELAKPHHDATLAWLGRKIGTSAETLTGAATREADNALLDLVHKVQLEAGRADISFASSFNPAAQIRQGDVTVRDIYNLYTAEDTLAVVELTGHQIKSALEHSASFFRPLQPGRSAAQLAKPDSTNFCTAEGVDFAIDLRRPEGDRIRHMTRNGMPFDLDSTYRVAISSSRRNGIGGYTMFRAAKPVRADNREVRDLIVGWVEQHREVPCTATGNWRFASSGD